MVARLAVSSSLISVALLAACSGSSPALTQPAAPAAPAQTSEAPADQAPVQTPSAAAPTPTPQPTPSQGRLIDYRTSSRPQGVKISGSGDVSKLEGAPEQFKAFVPGEYRSGQGEFAGTTATMYVKGLHTDGYALGGFSASDGGIAAIWAVKNGSWKRIWSGQNVPDCAPLREVGFPSALLAFSGSTQCLNGGSTVRYTSGQGSSTTGSRSASNSSATGSGDPEKSCQVTEGMIEAIQRQGLNGGSNLSATCAGDWALLSSSEGGDTQMLLQRHGSGWEFYTGFPTKICRSQYLNAGGAQAYASRLGNC